MVKYEKLSSYSVKSFVLTQIDFPRSWEDYIRKILVRVWITRKMKILAGSCVGIMQDDNEKKHCPGIGTVVPILSARRLH